MAGTVKIDNLQLGDSLTATNNFVLKTNADGTAKLARGNVGATTQDILTVGADGKVTSEQVYMPAGTGAIPTTVQEKLRNMVTPFDFGAVGNGVSDDTLALQKFFDHISTTRVGGAEADGNFAISSQINIGPASGTMATLHISGNMTVTALNAIDTMVVVRNAQDLVWNGTLSAIGTGSTSYSSRTCRVGIKIGDSGSVGRTRFGGLIARRFSQVGVAVRELSTLTDLGNVRVSDCGSGISTAGYSVTANWSNKVDTGSSASTGQLSTIDVDQLPPSTIETPLFVVINSETYYVSTVDTVNSKISIFPWIDTGLTSGSLRYIFGAGVYTAGGDAGILGMNQIDAVRCSVGLYSDALYGMIASRVVTQSCGVGFAVGGSPAGAALTFQINGLYCENNDYDLMRVTRATIGGHIVSEYAFSFNKVTFTTNPRSSANVLSRSVGGALSSIIIDSNGVSNQWVKAPTNQTDDGSTFSLDLFSEPKYSRVARRNTWTVNLATPSTEINNAFGYDSGQLVCIGTNSNGSPTGAITFNAPVGSTVNGGSSAAFTGFTGPAVFFIYYRFASTDYLVHCVTYQPSGSAAYDPPSLGDGAGATTTVTVTGAALGDYAEASFSRDLQGITMTAWVSATDTVSVRFQNETGGTLDLASGTLRARVRKA